MAKPNSKKTAKIVPPAPQDDRWIAIGQIRKAVGLHGWLRVGILTDFPERFKPGNQVLVQRSDKEPESYTIAEERSHFSGAVLELKFAGIDDCESAQVFVHAMIVIPKAEREELCSDSEFYPDELEGMQVVSPQGQVVGKVLKLETDVPCPYVAIQADDDHEVLVPFRKVFIRSVDRKTRTLQLVESLSYHAVVV